MKSLSVLILVFMVSPAQASLFQEFYSRYKKSDRLQAIKLQSPINMADIQLNEDKYDWTLQMSLNNGESDLASLYSFQSQETKTKSHALSLEKSSFRFGTISFTHSQTEYDLSKWSNSALTSFSNEIQYESKNTLSYTYEILNKTKNIDWKVIQTQKKSNQLEQSLSEQKDAYDIFNSYLTAKQGIILDRLYNEFENRALERVKLVTKRVRDGLSRSVDLNQSRLSLLQQKETIIKNSSSLREKLIIIEEVVGMKITPAQYQLVSWSYKPKEDFDYLFESKESQEVERLKWLQRLNTLQMEKLDESINDSLVFGVSYVRNSFNSDSAIANRDALENSENVEQIVSLTYTLPLGISKSNASTKKLQSIINKNKLDLNNTQGEITAQLRTLKENIVRFSRAIEVLDEKVKISDKIVKQNYNLYIKGKSSFEVMIRSEETLISAKIDQMNMYALYEQSLAKLAYLNGDINKFLTQYVD